MRPACGTHARRRSSLLHWDGSADELRDWLRARMTYSEERQIEERSGYSTVDLGGEGDA